MSSSRRPFVLFALAALAALALGAGCIPHVERPSVRVMNVQFLNADAQNITFRVDMGIYNPNPFEVPIRDLSAQLSIEGREVGTVTIPSRHVLPPRRELPASSDVVMPWGGAASAMMSAMFAPQLNYALQGEVNATVGGFDVRVPYAHQGVVPRETLMRSASNALNGLIPGVSISMP